jgi:hypothetical protein
VPHRLTGSSATLRHLALSGSGWGTEDFAHVAAFGMPALEILYVPSCRHIGPRAWRALAGCPALTNLDVSNTSFNDASLRFVADGIALPALHALAATLCPEVSDLSPLAGHRTLEWLAVSFASSRNLWPLTSMARLHTLSLTGIPPALRDTQPPPAPGDIVGMPGCPADVSALSHCSQLTSIAMRGGCMIAAGGDAGDGDPLGLDSDDDEATGAFCRGLRVLDVRDCQGIREGPWLSRLRALEFLTLPSADDRFRSGGHPYIAGLPRLRRAEV